MLSKRQFKREKDTFKNNNEYVIVMGRKKRILDVWVSLTAIFGASFLIFNKSLEKLTTLDNELFVWFGIVLLVASLIISLSKAWR